MSREIDKEIAEHVMGLTGVSFKGEHLRHRVTTPRAFVIIQMVPYYSTDVADAWTVVEHLAAADPEIIQYGEKDGSWTWRVDFEGTNADDEDPFRDRSIARAICLAALRWRGLR